MDIPHPSTNFSLPSTLATRIVVIVGPTGSGKTALAIELSRKYQGEIICADSRTVYKGMDIGTAKPTVQEQATVPHHLIDIVNPDEPYTAAMFQRDARKKIEEITERKKLPIIVGGSGLYIDGLLYNFDFATPQPHLREALEKLSLEELQQKASDMGIKKTDINYNNRRHLQRAVERGGIITNKKELHYNALELGLLADSSVLKNRISKRVDHMMKLGLADEVIQLRKSYPKESASFLTPGYKAIGAYINEEIGIEEAKQRFVRSDMQLAKRQITWFKRNPRIVWLNTNNDYVSEAMQHTNLFLSS